MKYTYLIILSLFANYCLAQENDSIRERIFNMLVEKAEVHNQKGLEERKNGNYNEAIELFEKAYEIVPYFFYKTNIAETHVANSDYFSAMQVYNGLIEEELGKEGNGTQLSEYYLTRATYKMQLNDYRGAISDLDKNMELMKEFILSGDHTQYSYYAKINKIQCLIELERLDEGLKLCNDLIKNCKSIIEAENNNGLLNDWVEQAKTILPYAYEKLGLIEFHYLKDKEKACNSWSISGEKGNANAYNLIKKYCQN